MNKSPGFHLIEILIAVAIISILALLAAPLCSQYLMSARRFEAENTLTKLAIAMEQFHLEHNSYENATLTVLGFPEIIAHDQYQLKIETATCSDFIIDAIPISNLAKKDISCATLSLNDQGEKGMSGSGNVNECW